MIRSHLLVSISLGHEITPRQLLGLITYRMLHSIYRGKNRKSSEPTLTHYLTWRRIGSRCLHLLGQLLYLLLISHILFLKAKHGTSESMWVSRYG